MLLDGRLRLYLLLGCDTEHRVRVVASVCAAALPFLLARACWKKRSDDTTHQLPVALPEKCRFLVGHVGEFQLGLQNMYNLVVAPAIDGVTKVYMPMYEQVISVTRAEHVKQVLNASSLREPIPVVHKHFKMFAGKNSVVIAEKTMWRVLRNIMGKIFQVAQLRNMVEDMSTSAAEFVEALKNKHGETVDLCDMFRLVTVDVIGKVVFGHDFGCCKSLQQPEVVSSFQFTLQSFHDRMVNAIDPRFYFYCWPSEHNRRFLKSSATVRSFITDIIAAKRAVPPSERKADILQMMIDASEDDHCGLSDEDFVDSMISLLFAGYDTTAITLANAMAAIAQHPEVEAKALQEITSVLGADGLPTYEHLTAGLPYCSAVIKETLRLWPAGPLTTRHLQTPLHLTLRPRRSSTSTTSPSSTPADAEPMTVAIPAGRLMWVPIWWVHRDPANFEDPLSFDPERFADPAREARIPKYAYVPFSGGVRDCPGRKLAMMEAVAVFVVCLRALAFEPTPGYTPHYVFQCLVAEPEGGIPMRVRARDRDP